jgi:ubiquitin-protein ligase
VDDRYRLEAIPPGSELTTSRGLNVLKNSFEQFKSRIRKNQKGTSMWRVTRWAVHDAEKMQSILDRMKDFVDGLEAITQSLGLLEQQHSRLLEEIDTILDVESLRLLCDAASSYRSSTSPEISDTASRRLITVEEGSIASRSLITFRTRPSTLTGSNFSTNHPIPGAWPKSMTLASRSIERATIKSGSKRKPRIEQPCGECLEEHYNCTPIAANRYDPCVRCSQKNRVCSFSRIDETLDETNLETEETDQVLELGTLPQQQRIVMALRASATPQKQYTFIDGDRSYGERLATFKREDENFWLESSAKMLLKADSGSSAAKRMFRELRDIRRGKVPFVTATPIDHCLDKILASVEGPPETPYEGGIFWITIRLSQTNPLGPPLMRFQTRIYHPNISPQGHICANYQEKWNMSLAGGKISSMTKNPDHAWFQPRSTNVHWTLGALLIAICGLLASPDVDDPLVPDIAEKYILDYEGYCEGARLYTQRYARGGRPQVGDLLFPQESTDPVDGASSFGNISSQFSSRVSNEEDADKRSIQSSLRVQYDDKYPTDAEINLSSVVSHESTSSSSLSSFRNKLQLLTQNRMAAARPLMPKGDSGDTWMSRNPSLQSMTRLDLEDSSEKAAISKPTYQRPKHGRVFCQNCDGHPEGFRGEHELRRHQDREHQPLVKNWVCVEPTDGHDHPKPTIPLSKCKTCSQQKKYGAYYNAAAHLRRTHFKPKTSKRSKSSKGDSDEKRGGKRCGDWPPMSELKCWMKEVEEMATEYPLTACQQDEADASDDSWTFTRHTTMPTITSNTFDNAIFGVSFFGVSKRPAIA